jgi:hypothetical protein
MSLAHGYGAWIGYAEESSFGTPVTATKFLEIESESIKAEKKLNVVPLLGHVSQRRTVASKMNVNGQFRAPVLWEGIERFFKHALGSVNTTGPSGGLYTHTFSLAADLPTGLTIEVNRDDAAISGNGAFQYAGCKINKFVLAQEMEQPLMMEVDILGTSLAMIAATSKTFPTYDAIDYAQLTVAQIDPGGGAEFSLPLRTLKITIDNALHDDQYRLGSANRAGITRGGQRKVNIEAEIEFESLTAYTYYRTLANDNLRFKWVSGSKSLQIDCPNCTFDGEEPASEDAGPYYLTISNTALVSSADNDELSLVLINTVSSV